MVPPGCGRNYSLIPLDARERVRPLVRDVARRAGGALKAKSGLPVKEGGREGGYLPAAGGSCTACWVQACYEDQTSESNLKPSWERVLIAC